MTFHAKDFPSAVWTGAGDPPAVGSVVKCNDRKGTLVRITGYEQDGKWLMAQGFRVAEPHVRGNLAGAEILYPKPPAAGAMTRGNIVEAIAEEMPAALAHLSSGAPFDAALVGFRRVVGREAIDNGWPADPPANAVEQAWAAWAAWDLAILRDALAASGLAEEE